MDLLTLLASLVFTFGLLCFGSLTYSWVRELRSAGCQARGAHGPMVSFSTFWFAVLLLAEGLKVIQPELQRACSVSTWSIAFLWPPMILWLMYSEPATKSRRPHRWKGILAGLSSICVAAGTVPIAYLLGVLPSAWLPGATLIFAGSFVFVAVQGILLERKRQDSESRAERSNRFWNLLLWGLVFVVMGSVVLDKPQGLKVVFDLVGPAFPLLFLFVNSYFMERLTFFDLFVKRGSFLILAILLLAGSFRATSFIWTNSSWEGTRIWASTLMFLPMALALPWLYNVLNSWLDRVWLGRRFSAREAVRHFLAGTQSATSEPELIDRAQQLLLEIFQAPVQIVFEKEDRGSETERKEEGASIEVPIRLEGKVAGSVRVGRRENRIPLFSRDVALLVSLAEVFAYNLENVRLHSRKQEQEKRARELMIHASRSELKALRAQINPHFLFNALNAIASLIPRQPQRAESTVEQLAEVFRYTLRESDKEWTQLEDELEFVRAYLEVEKARFGDRLSTEIVLDPELRSVRIPTMIVHTLVENAIKHGILMVRGGGELRVEALRREERVRIEVTDTGPGFGRELAAGEVPASSTGTGFGLRSVKERLEGYFGESARLELRRDEPRGLTIAAIEFPASVAFLERKTGTRA